MRRALSHPVPFVTAGLVKTLVAANEDGDRAPNFSADLTALPLPSGFSFLRASSAEQRGSGGVYSQVSAGVPRIETNRAGDALGVLIEPQGRNYLRNSSGLRALGATTVATWTLPSVSGITVAVEADGVTNGRPWVDLRVSGTAAISAGGVLLFEASGIMPATSADTVSVTTGIALVGGTLDGISTVKISLSPRNSGGSGLTLLLSDDLVVSSTVEEFSASIQPSDATTASVQPGIQLGFTSGIAVNALIRIVLPQAELALQPSSRIVTSMQDVSLTDNLIPAPASWGTVGTPGTLPTGWAISAVTGLAYSVAAVGADYVDVTVSGTPASTTSFTFTFTSITAISAVQGDTVGVSARLDLRSGTLAGVSSIALSFVERTVAGVALSNNNGPALPVQGDRSFSWANTVAQATAGRVQPAVRVAVTSGASVDFTLRLYRPGCALNGNVSSNTTRAAETLQYSLASWFNGVSGALAVRFAVARPGTAYTLMELGDGTSANRLAITSTDGRALRVEAVKGGVAETPINILTGAALAADELATVAFSWSAGTVRVSLSGAPEVTVPVNPLTAATTLYLGHDYTGAGQSGAHFRDIRAWSSALAAPELRGAGRVAEEALRPMMLHIIGYGQSYSTGSWGIPTPAMFYHPEQTRRVFMLEATPGLTTVNDVRLGRQRLSGSAPLEQQRVTDDVVIGVIPAASRRFSTSSHGMTISEVVGRLILPAAEAAFPTGVRVLVSVAGVGGAGIRSLRKVPTVPLSNGNVAYNDMLVMIRRAKALAEAQGFRYRMAAILWQGNTSDGTLYTVPAELAGLRAELRADLQAMGQTFDPVWITDQFSVHENTEEGGVLGLTQAAEAGTAYLVGPNYWMMQGGGYHTDNLHFSPKGYTWVAEYFAAALSPALFGGAVPKHLRPLAAVRSGAQITVSFDVPVAPLVLDAVSVNDPGDFGFEVTDGGSPATILTVEVVGGTSVRITLASTPTGAVRVRYAMKGYVTPFSGGYVASEQPRGCLRDSATTVATYDGTTLRNWCVHFDLAV